MERIFTKQHGIVVLKNRLRRHVRRSLLSLNFRRVGFGDETNMARARKFAIEIHAIAYWFH